MPLKAFFFFFQKMGYLIYFENSAFKIFHLSIPCGDPKSVVTPDNLKCGAHLCHSSLPALCSHFIWLFQKVIWTPLSPFSPSLLPISMGRKVKQQQSQCAAPHGAWCSWSWCFPVAPVPSAVPECAPSHTPATRNSFEVLWVHRSQVMAWRQA